MVPTNEVGESMKPTLMRLFAGVLVCLWVVQAAAQQYPSKPVRMIVPYAPGGGVDIIGRFIARHFTDRLGMQFVVDNRAGGGTIIGTELAARAAPNGYTLLVANTALTASPSLHAKIPFDPAQSFAAVCQISSSYSVLVVHPSVPVKTVTALIALAKARPGDLNYASAGMGSSIHLAMEIFQRAAGVKFVHIPYKGAAPAVNDVLGGQVPIMFASLSTSVEHIRAGRFRGLGVSSTKRRPVLPDVPTIAESGLPGFEMNSWQGIMAPARTPREIITRLNSETNAILKLAEVKQFFAKIGPDPAGGTPEELGDRIAKEVVLWRQVLGAPKQGA
jgi:tripartite-type tricarboxylate transporter receptor subunit TctC